MAITFLIADTFTDSLARLTGDEQKAAKTTAFDLQLDPSARGLSFHKLDRAKDKRFWSLRVNADIRLIVHRTDQALLLCYVDHPDRAYGWAERRKLETHPSTGAAQMIELRESVREVVIPSYVQATPTPTPQTCASSARRYRRSAVGGFFGFKIGTDGELARYPKILDYFQLIAKQTDRVKYEELGKTTMGNSYPLLRISSPQNLAKFDRLVEINRRLADPRGLSDADARRLAAEGKPFYLVYATIHSTEVSNGQAIIHIVHRLATENSVQIREILDNSVVLMVPSQNPDGQHLVIDHWYKTKGTPFNRVYPDLYHKYVGHDDNRDWFMFTQKETRMNIDLVQNKYKPIVSHDMHQQGANGSRIFVPPFTDPFDPNIHPLLALGQATVGQAMASALLAEGKEGVAWAENYDMWTPARQYMVYHGQPRILTEIANGNLADRSGVSLETRFRY